MTLTALIQQGLLLAMRQPQTTPTMERVTLPECYIGGGVAPGVDLDDTADLIGRMDWRG